MLTHHNKCLDTSDIVILETYIQTKALGLNLSGKVRKKMEIVFSFHHVYAAVKNDYDALASQPFVGCWFWPINAS